MKILFNVSCNDEYIDEHPTTAIVEFTKESIERIFRLNKAVKKLEVIKICDWDNIEWLDNNPIEDNEEPKIWEGRSECEMFSVWSDSISWRAYLKNTCIEFSTYDSIYMNTLKEILKIVDKDILIHSDNLNEVIKVYNTPDKDLPLLIADLKSEEAKDILQERLKKNG